METATETETAQETETSLSMPSEVVLSIEAAPPHPSSIKHLETLHAALAEQIENENFAKRYAKLLESERLLKETVASLEGDMMGLRLKIEELEAAENRKQGNEKAIQTDPETCQRQPKIDTLKAEVLELKRNMKTKARTIRALEREKSLKKPLVQVGVDIRIGCLERNKEGYLDDYSADPVSIEKRNVAAHEGNWKADAALITLGYLTEESLNQGDSSKMSWNNVYISNHALLAQDVYVPPNCIKAVNHHFTMMGAKMPEGREANEIIKATQSTTIRVLKEWQRLEDKDKVEVRKSFQLDEEIFFSVIKLRNLKNSAVRLAWKMNERNKS
ncbi:hypothetical protein ONS95_009598 [Cadophora gregata]|uniref:uncharacterized protein n=1 Tax=Cadophora gregata TaxID=51156 RepID=UPI0026DD06CF|nr:uncharacterized protein ONS95_009598 [Cadophora gregata]KAK0124652.1 hypothetical protein ONS95_009598 [Cadophora gregata]KAK0129488.1 hypothetical protein ONS96_000057 [Cadophora gregata f. sp. sojae]